MSSSGVIYAIIVGAWAVYLVPMWLRREDELNRARQTQRYAAAIKVLANKDAFERRWAREAESDADIALPIAAGQGFVPTSTARAAASKAAVKAVASTTKPKASKAASATKTVTKASKITPAPAPATTTTAATSTSGATSTKPQRKTVAAAKTSASARSGAKSAVTATVARTQRPAITAGLGGRTASGSRVGLMARRRRVVGLLFTASTLGALISADLGARFLWVMAIPAALLSGYIVWLRRDERTQASSRTRRRAAAQEAQARAQAKAQAQAQVQRKAVARREAKAAREARDKQQLAQAMEERQELLDRLDAEAEIATGKADQRRQTQAARRRSTAAARARAQVFTQTQDAQDLPRASNG